jgi:hypothetical protein
MGRGTINRRLDGGLCGTPYVPTQSRYRSSLLVRVCRGEGELASRALLCLLSLMRAPKGREAELRRIRKGMWQMGQIDWKN